MFECLSQGRKFVCSFSLHANWKKNYSLFLLNTENENEIEREKGAKQTESN